MNDNIRRLQEQIEAERKKISSCKHIFNKPFYNPETTREPYGYRLVGHGSDVWGEIEGYRDVKKDRWSRVCSECGLEQHTYEQTPVISTYEPKFK